MLQLMQSAAMATLTLTKNAHKQNAIQYLDPPKDPRSDRNKNTFSNICKVKNPEKQNFHTGFLYPTGNSSITLESMFFDHGAANAELN